MLLLLLPLAGGCSSNTLPLSEVVFSGSSQQPEVERIYFRVPEGESCAGVRIRTEGNKLLLSFVRADSDARVDAATLVSTEEPWKGQLYVEVPIGAELLEKGGRLKIVAEDTTRQLELVELGYPPAASADAH